MGRREVMRGAVSGKSLASAPCVVVLGTNAGAVIPAARDHLRLGTSGALLSSDDLRVEHRANGEASSVISRSRCERISGT
jgi:hypothetical protein